MVTKHRLFVVLCCPWAQIVSNCHKSVVQVSHMVRYAYRQYRVSSMHAPQWGPLTTDDIQWQWWGIAKLLCILSARVVQNDTTGASYNDCPPTKLGGHYLPRQCGRWLMHSVLGWVWYYFRRSRWLSNFAFTCIQENNTPEEKETCLHILFSQTVAVADTCPHSWALAQACFTQVRQNPCEVGANYPATLMGSKWWEGHCYGHCSRYRAVHHTVAGWVWPAQPTTQY